MASNDYSKLGADPVNIKWNVVRGDTANILVQFYEPNEVSFYDTSTWSYTATAYNPANESFDELEVNPGEGFVEIIAPADITETWGSGIKAAVGELRFDLEILIDNDKTWTPVIGTISVVGDVTGGTL
jgi:hypothetical protein